MSSFDVYQKCKVTTTPALDNSIEKFYPHCTGVYEAFYGHNDDGFYISFDDNSYTYLRLDISQNVEMSDKHSLWNGLAQDNFDKSRWFKVCYDSVEHTFEIVYEFKEAE